MSSDAITSVIYDEKDPIFLKIREKFKEKLTIHQNLNMYNKLKQNGIHFCENFLNCKRIWEQNRLYIRREHFRIQKSFLRNAIRGNIIILININKNTKAYMAFALLL